MSAQDEEYPSEQSVCSKILQAFRRGFYILKSARYNNVSCLAEIASVLPAIKVEVGSFGIVVPAVIHKNTVERRCHKISRRNTSALMARTIGDQRKQVLLIGFVPRTSATGCVIVLVVSSMRT